MGELLLQMEGIHKSFPGVLALDDVSSTSGKVRSTRFLARTEPASRP